VQSTTREYPSGVCPPGAIMRRVGISFLVGVLVVNAVCSDPENRPPLEREAAAHGDEIFDPLGGFVTAMREQAMVGHPDTDVDGEEVHDDKAPWR